MTCNTFVSSRKTFGPVAGQDAGVTDTRKNRPIGKAEAARIKKLLETYSAADVAVIVKRAHGTINRLKRRGFKPAFADRLRPVPMDWNLYRNTMTKHELARHYATNLQVITRWAAETGRDYKARPTGHPKEVPADLAEVMARMQPRDAARHYGVHRATLLKWRKQLGLPVMATWNRKTVSQFKWWERKAA